MPSPRGSWRATSTTQPPCAAASTGAWPLPCCWLRGRGAWPLPCYWLRGAAPIGTRLATAGLAGAFKARTARALRHASGAASHACRARPCACVAAMAARGVLAARARPNAAQPASCRCACACSTPPCRSVLNLWPHQLPPNSLIVLSGRDELVPVQVRGGKRACVSGGACACTSSVTRKHCVHGAAAWCWKAHGLSRQASSLHVAPGPFQFAALRARSVAPWRCACGTTH